MLTHRYLGIALGLVVCAWCLSGIVMMYVPYPSVSPQDQLTSLTKLDLTNCCDASSLTTQDAVLAVDSFVVEMWHQRPLLRLTLTNGERTLFDLSSGDEIKTLDRDAVLAVGLDFARTNNFTNAAHIGDIEMDQWTVHARFGRHRPMHVFEDEAATQWYVSSQTGEVVQITRREERFWNWMGSVVHWLYPTFLRKNTALWVQVVVWLTIVSLFLTITGIAFGLKQYKSRTSNKKSPYTGWSLWHHYSGLVFGLFTFTWLLSGVFSMNPWGALEGRSFEGERLRLLGETQTLGHVFKFIRDVHQLAPEDTVRLTSTVTKGVLSLLALNRSADLVRINVDGLAEDLQIADAREIAETLKPAVRIEQIDLLKQADAYYYPHHDDKSFPVLRLQFTDGERYYLNPRSGELELALDKSRTWYRWVFNALHTGDFHRMARSRPFWDVWMLILLVGLSVGTGTGVVLAFKRLTS